MIRPAPPALAASILVAIVAASCAGSTLAPSPIPTPPGHTPTPVPGAPGSSAGGGSGGGGGLVPPGGPGDGVFDGQATMVVPVPGQLDPHVVNVQALRSSVDGHHVQVELRWWSGVAPCSVLDSVRVDRSDELKTISVTAIEGSSARDVACIDIAQLKATVVDLGELPLGSWTIRAAGDAAPITVVVA